MSTLIAAGQIQGEEGVGPQPVQSPHLPPELLSRLLPCDRNFDLVCPVSCLHGMSYELAGAVLFLHLDGAFAHFIEMDVGHRGLSVRSTFSRQAPRECLLKAERGRYGGPEWDDGYRNKLFLPP